MSEQECQMDTLTMASMWLPPVFSYDRLRSQMHSLQGIVSLCLLSVFVKHNALISYLYTLGLLK